MSIIHQARVILCLLLLGGFVVLPMTSAAQGVGTAPTLASVVMSSPVGMVSVSGSGFTSGGLVHLIVHDLSGSGPTVDSWTVAENGTISVSVPYLTGATFGPQGSQDPAQGYVPGTLGTSQTQAAFGANGSQDPAQGYSPAASHWIGACPDVLVHALDVRAEKWSNTLDVQLTDC